MTDIKFDEESVNKILIDFLQSNMGVTKDLKIPMDESLLAAGIIDSFAIIELAEFIESTWGFKIDDSEFVGKNFGSLNKIIQFIILKVGESGQ